MPRLDLDAVMERMVLATGWTTGIGAYGSERRVTIDAALADIPALVERARAGDALAAACFNRDHCVVPDDDGDPCEDCEIAYCRAVTEYEAARDG